MTYFDKTTSVDSKFDRSNKFYDDFKILILRWFVKSENEDTEKRKIKVLKNASLLSHELNSIYKKEYDQVFKSKGKNGRLKHNFSNLKDLDYQADKLQRDKLQPDKLQPHQLVQPKWVKVG